MEPDEKKYYDIPDFKTGILEFRQIRHFENPNKDYHFFTDVYVNPIVLIKMMKHSLTSKNEIIGQISGHIDQEDHSYLLTDTISYPLVGTDSRVQVDSSSLIKVNDRRSSQLPKLGRTEDDVGWYHSHPNLNVFYSSTDVRNHINLYNAKGGTAVGLVIDPINTVVSGHLKLGAYSINDPEKVKDMPPPADAVFRKYGSAANSYYELAIHYFCTDLDKLILNDFIAKTYGTSLQSSPLELNANYIIDSIEKSKKDVNANEDKDPLVLEDKIPSINKERKIGLWIHRKKKHVFG